VLFAYNDKSTTTGFGVFEGYSFDGPQQQVFNAANFERRHAGRIQPARDLDQHRVEDAAPSRRP